MKLFLPLLLVLNQGQGFLLPVTPNHHSVRATQRLFLSQDDSSTTSPTPKKRDVATDDTYFLNQQTRGGYTVKQRLREEVESPFRKVRLLFFGSSAGSALTALYFSMLSTIKAIQGGYADAPPLDEALTSDAINIGAAIICGVLCYRELKVGQANLERIAKGGQLASLVLQPADGSARRKVADYRRYSRVLIAAGGEDYITRLCKSMGDANTEEARESLAGRLQASDVLVVPVLLSSTTGVGDTQAYWESVKTESESNPDFVKTEEITAYPLNSLAWAEYLKSEIETASGQGFDVMDKGITLTIKKNGRILRRATGLPPWGEIVATMEVLDGSQFGMPGDSEKYGV